jgi:hypothetical protein
MSEQYQPIQMEEYMEKTRATKLAEPLRISHRRRIHFLHRTDEYHTERVVLRDGYKDHGTEVEVVGKGLEVPLKDWPDFASRVAEITASLKASGKIPE